MTLFETIKNNKDTIVFIVSLLTFSFVAYDWLGKYFVTTTIMDSKIEKLQTEIEMTEYFLLDYQLSNIHMTSKKWRTMDSTQKSSYLYKHWKCNSLGIKYKMLPPTEYISPSF